MRDTNIPPNDNQQFNFYINDIGLRIPPTSISVYKEGLNYSVKSLRTKSSVKMASGNGIYHAQVNLVFSPDEFLALHRLICQIKNNPFVFIKNAFLKDSIDISPQINSTNSLFFTVMGVNINNHAASPGSFIVELDLRYFNNNPFSENLRFKKTLEVGGFNVFESTEIPADNFRSQTVIAVPEPKDSEVYVQYGNYLQIQYLKKYFGFTENQLVKILTDSLERKKFSSGKKSLHDSIYKKDLAREIYLKSKYTRFKVREFVKLKLDRKLSEFLRKEVDKGVTLDMSEEAKRDTRKTNLNSLYKLDSAPPNSEDFKKAHTGSFSIGREFNPQPNFDLQGNGIKGWFVRNGTMFSRTSMSSVEGEQDVVLKIFLHSVKRNGAPSIDPNIYLPMTMDFIRVSDSNKSMTFSGGQGHVEIQSELLFFNKYKHLKGRPAIKANQVIGSLQSGKSTEITIRIRKSTLETLPDYRKYFDSIRSPAKNARKRQRMEEMQKVEKFLLENYQPYLDRKDTVSIFETIKTIDFLDFKNYELELLSGRPEETPDVEIQFDSNTVITNINGSLRHITPSIPILGQETPTHQFLGSMEPNYEIALIGKGNPATFRMPDSFLLLEDMRKSGQEKVKRFSEIPDSSNFAIDSLITKLLGSYEADYHKVIDYTDFGNSKRLYSEKFNFSMNSTNTFTVEAQPNTYGMNIHFQEAASYKEEEIRPAFTNYNKTNIDDLYTKLFNYKTQTPPPAPKPKPASKPKVVPSANVESGYEWMNWTTRHFNATQWYETPRGYDQAKAETFKGEGRDITLPFDAAMQKVKKYFVTKSYPGKLWKEKELESGGYAKVSESTRQSSQIVNHDKAGYLCCLLLDDIQDFVNILYKSNKDTKIYLNSTLRLNNELDYIKRRGNHKSGSGSDFRVPGVNPVELTIYIYLMQLLGYVKDPTDTRRKGVFTGIGIYGKCDTKKVKMQKKTGRHLHVDINALVAKYVIEDGGKKHAFHVAGRFQPGLRNWYVGYDTSKLNIFSLLKKYKQVDDLTTKRSDTTAMNKQLNKGGFLNLEEYVENVKAAKLIIDKKHTPKIVSSNTLSGFWENKLKAHINTVESIPLENLNLITGEEGTCGANITTYLDGNEYTINLFESDNTNINWYPASMIKFIPAVLSVKRLEEIWINLDASTLEVEFATKTSGLVARNFSDILFKALVNSENLEFSLLVAIAGHNIVQNELAWSTIEINYPMTQKKADYARTWWNYSGGNNYDTKDKERNSRWKAENIELSRPDQPRHPISVSHGKRGNTSRTCCGTVEDFSKLMREAIAGKYYTDSSLNILVRDYLKQNKGHAATVDSDAEANVGDPQNSIKNNILAKLNPGHGYTVYHKPGYAKAPKSVIGRNQDSALSYFWCDCLYFQKDTDSSVPSFAITIWGRNDTSVVGRPWLDDNWFNDESHVGLTSLLGYCIKYNSVLIEYIKSQGGSND